LRGNLLKARDLLAQAGWHYKDGALRNSKGEIFEFEMLEDSPFLLRILTAYVRNLEKLGIKANVRTTDFALYQKRLDEHDFDMTTIRYMDSQSTGNELLDRFGSMAADQNGSDNHIGVRSKAVDQIIAEITNAETPTKLYAASRSTRSTFDSSIFCRTHWYNPTHRVAYSTELGFPPPPLYYTAEWWILSNWWRKSVN
jgi:microcin C transport system substrate-binding protein